MKKYSLFVALAISIALSTILRTTFARSGHNANKLPYNVACMKEREADERALTTSYQFRKKLLDKNGVAHTCFFRIKDSDIRCVNPNYLRTVGRDFLAKEGFSINDAIAGGHLTETKAGSVCYFKDEAIPTYRSSLLSKWLPENNKMSDFDGAQFSAEVINRAKNKLEAAKELLEKPLFTELDDLE